MVEASQSDFHLLSIANDASFYALKRNKKFGNLNNTYTVIGPGLNVKPLEYIAWANLAIKNYSHPIILNTSVFLTIYEMVEATRKLINHFMITRENESYYFIAHSISCLLDIHITDNGIFDKKIYLAPAISSRFRPFIKAVSSILPARFPIPSLNRPTERVYSALPFSLYKEMHGLPIFSNDFEHSNIKVFYDLRDEFISAKEIRTFFPQEICSEVSGLFPHHNFYNPQTFTKKSWTNLLKEVCQWLYP